MAELNIVTQNVQGLADTIKRQQIATWMAQQNIDILCLQETHTTSQGTDWQATFPQHTIFHAHGSNHARGVSIIVRHIPQLRCTPVLSDPDGRYLLARITYGTFEFDLLTIYAPNNATDRRDFFGTISNLLTPNRESIICGDFNCVADPKMDRKSNARLNQRSSDTYALQHIMATLNVVDVYRKRCPSTAGYTWTRTYTQTAARLDMFLVSATLESRVKTVAVLPTAISDHFGVALRLTTWQKDETRGRGYWKFNSAFLSEKAFRRRIVAFWSHWRYQRARFSSLADWWDAGKAHIKRICQQYGMQRKRQRHKHRLRLERSIRRVQDELQAGNMSVMPKLDFLKNRLQEYERDSVRGTQIRSKAQWVDSGETSKRYFTTFEKIKSENSHITHLVQGNIHLTGKDEILSAVHTFYSDLYKRETVEEEQEAREEMVSAIDKQLSATEREDCEQPLQMADFTNALKHMKTNKSPGSDGLTVEFYRSFWTLLSADFLDVVSEIHKMEKMPLSLRTGIIRLLPKKGDRTTLTNWRPISLLNVDYKLIAKVLANRLNKVLGSIIHPDQTCTIQGRTIHDNCATVRDVINYCDKQQRPAAVISLDQAKAFDRVSWDYLSSVLSGFGFGMSFCAWVGTLYNDIGSHVIINGRLTSRIHLERGVRQGCPLSPMLYVLSLEPLMTKIRQNPYIQGMTVTDPERNTIKISAYADDMTCFVSSNDSFVALNDELVLYEKASGARLNRSKSVGLWLGQWANRSDTPLDIQWETNEVKILGLIFTPSYYASITRNWSAAIQKLQNALQKWATRELSIFGRARVLTTHTLTKVYYPAYTFTMPVATLRKLEDIIWNYLWKGGTPAVRRSVCISSIKRGGVGMPHLPTRLDAIHLQAMRRLFDPSNKAAWKSFAVWELRNVSGQYNMGLAAFAACRWRPDVRNLAKLSPFLRQLVRLWQRHGGGRKPNPPTTYEEACNEPLWGNPLITNDQGRPLFFPSMAKCCFSTVGDLYHKSPPHQRTKAASIYPHTLQAIPANWRHLPQTLQSSMHPHWATQLCLFNQSDDPLFLQDANTRTIYQRIVKSFIETPVSQKTWESNSMKLSDIQWERLWVTPQVCSWHSIVDREVLWRLLHRTLSTQTNLCRWNLVSSTVLFCPACNLQEDTMDHVFGSCSFWRQILRSALLILKSINVTTDLNEQSHVFDLLLQHGWLQQYFGILVTTYWLKRKTAPPRAIIAYFRWKLKRHISIDWARNQSHFGFSSFWTSLARNENGRLIFNDILR